jgi:hypothetical protein
MNGFGGGIWIGDCILDFLAGLGYYFMVVFLDFFSFGGVEFWGPGV